MPAPAALAGIAALMVASAPALAMDCVKARSAVERLICQSPVLRQQDRVLNAQYRFAMEMGARAAQLQGEQAAWLVRHRDACAQATCLTQAYASRIAELDAFIDTTAQPCAIRESMLVGPWSGLRDAEFDVFELQAGHVFNSWRHERPEYSGLKWAFDANTCRLDLFVAAGKPASHYRLFLTPRRRLLALRQQPPSSSVYQALHDKPRRS
ncbi:lysozyme inhibitor LprI family protein [Chromobacterium sp. LK1]|uniref:lysozyme inhibitor LprI family protein n=1 Tax=Chromobacterium sp. LK1 TaxID=1628193 RepID=UPI00069CC280|nr:lysozyme inhibitor LprI family protein [Chromobacterium sp. LK1]